MQLFGAVPDELATAGAMAADAGFAAVDLNAGCPVKKVVRGGAGAALLKEPDRFARCVESLRRAVPGHLSVKIRAGWDAASVNCGEIARIAEDQGVDRITLHPRTRSQGYGGRADWSLVSDLAASCGVPVVGNGDIRDAEDAVRRLHDHGCAAVMIGRAALAIPCVFPQAEDRLAGRPESPAPAPESVGDQLVRQLRDLAEWKSERTAVVEMRKFVAWATKGYVGAAEFRRRAQTLPGAAELEEHIRVFFANARTAARHGGEE